jgi:hypothetical protein
VLAGDNAVVIGLAAARLPAEERKRAIIIGILVATALRILFARHNSAIAAGNGLIARWRSSSSLGLLEDVARAAHDVARSATRGRHVGGIRPRRQRHYIRTSASQEFRPNRTPNRGGPTARCPRTRFWPWQALHASIPSSLPLASS